MLNSSPLSRRLAGSEELRAYTAKKLNEMDAIFARFSGNPGTVKPRLTANASTAYVRVSTTGQTTENH
jgi:hypothetical protein